MRRTTTATVALLATGLLLAGCGRDGNGGATAEETGQEVSEGPATGEISIWAMGAEGEKLPELVKEFEDANPDVTVDVTAVPWDSAHDKFTTAIAAGETPDAAMVGSTWMGEFSGLGALDPTPPSIDSGDFFEGAWGTTEVDGTSYGVPWYVETRVVYYRTDLAEQAGWTEPPTDWDGLKQMASDMQSKAGAEWGIGMQAGGTGSWQTVMPFAWSNGAELTKDDGTAYNFDDPKTAEAVEYYQSFFTDGISDKNAPVQPTTEPDFVSGRVPMFISGPWMMSAVEAQGGEGFADKYGVFQIPAKEISSSFVGGSNLAVFKDSENRDSAWKLVEWLSEPETQVKWYDISTDLPAVTSAWDDPALADDEKLATFGTQLETAKAPPSFPTWEQVVTEFDSALERVTKQDADVAESLTEVQGQADSIGTGQ
ncbi:sugar ABC transporter substrate-binding protein [Angustibacter speluncae]